MHEFNTSHIRLYLRCLADIHFRSCICVDFDDYYCFLKIQFRHTFMETHMNVTNLNNAMVNRGVLLLPEHNQSDYDDGSDDHAPHHQPNDRTLIRAHVLCEEHLIQHKHITLLITHCKGDKCYISVLSETKCCTSLLSRTS